MRYFLLINVLFFGTITNLVADDFMCKVSYKVFQERYSDYKQGIRSETDVIPRITEVKKYCSEIPEDVNEAITYIKNKKDTENKRVVAEKKEYANKLAISKKEKEAKKEKYAQKQKEKYDREILLGKAKSYYGFKHGKKLTEKDLPTTVGFIQYYCFKGFIVDYNILDYNHGLNKVDELAYITNTQNKCSDWTQISMKKFNNLTYEEENQLILNYERDVKNGVVKKDENRWNLEAEKNGSFTVF